MLVGKAPGFCDSTCTLQSKDVHVSVGPEGVFTK